VGEAQFYGAELDLRAPLIKGKGHQLDMIANHTEMRGEITQNNGITREVKDMPRRTSNLGLDYQHRPTGWNAGVSVNHTPAFSRTSLNDSNELERKRREAYTLIDAYVGKKLGDRYEFRLIGRNLGSVEKDETTDKLNADGSFKSREQKIETSEPTVYLTLETRF
jgi:outer membrane receptor protein involved in Fe transport